jgi:hypothetical protein
MAIRKYRYLLIRTACAVGVAMGCSALAGYASHKSVMYSFFGQDVGIAFGTAVFMVLIATCVYFLAKWQERALDK